MARRVLFDGAMPLGVFAALSYAAVAWLTAGGADIFVAQASLPSPHGAKASAPVMISITSWATDADREALIVAVTHGGSAVARELLAMHDDVGTIQLGARRTALKYAHARPTLGGRLITLLTAEPMLFLGSALPDSKSRAGYDFGVVLLDLDAAGFGQGELSPIATIRINGDNAVVADKYGTDLVRLLNVKNKQK